MRTICALSDGSAPASAAASALFHSASESAKPSTPPAAPCAASPAPRTLVSSLARGCDADEWRDVAALTDSRVIGKVKVAIAVAPNGSLTMEDDEEARDSDTDWSDADAACSGCDWAAV
jgi:hypothetical protein